LAVLVASAAHAGRGAAQEPVVDATAEARALYRRGEQAFEKKRFSEAASLFESAANLKQSKNAVALYTAGIAWELAAKPERAADAFARALDGGGLDPKQLADAKDKLAQIEKTMGTLIVTSAEPVRVQLDASTEVPTPARLHAPGGMHVLSVRAYGKPLVRRDISVATGRVASFEVHDESPPRPEVAPACEPPVDPALTAGMQHDSYWITRRVVGVAVAGVGLAAVGSAILLGVNALDAKDVYNNDPSRGTFDQASSLQTWTNVTWISAAALLATGAALVVWPESSLSNHQGAARWHVVASLPMGGALVRGVF